MMKQGAFASNKETNTQGTAEQDPVDLVMETSTSAGYPQAYNTASGYEQDPDVIRGEMMFYSTPLTEKYSDAVYGTIRNIQGQCGADFQTVCPSSSPFVSFNYLMGELLAPMQSDYVFRHRKLTESSALKHFRTGAEYVNYLRSFYSTQLLPSFIAHPLSSVMYRDGKTGKFVNPGKEKERERASAEKSAPGGQLSLSNKPRSYGATGGGHRVHTLSDTHRRLRSVAPAPAPAPEEQPLPARKPCSGIQRGQGMAQQAADGSASAGSASGMDFRQFVLDFLHGRDMSLSMRSPLVMVDGNMVALRPPRASSRGDDDGDDDRTAYYSYEDDGQGGDDAYSYNDDGGAYYYYGDDAVGADDAADDDDDDAGGEDDGYGYDDAGGVTVRVQLRPTERTLEGVPQQRPLPRTVAPRAPLMGGPLPAPLSFRPEDHHHDHHHDHHDHDGDHHHHHDDGPGSSEEGEGPGPSSGEQVADPSSSEDHAHSWPWGRGDSSSFEGSSEEHGRWHAGPPVPPDHSFSGSLGFGADGDMCLYRGMAQGRVSDDCIGAVSDLYQLRAQYWQESQQPQDAHHHGLGFMLLLMALLAGCLVRRLYALKYEKRVRSLLTALHTHPSLRASVEAETGQEVPLPRPSPSFCCSGQDGGRCNGSALARCCKVVTVFVALFFVAFWVSITSLHFTQHVVQHLDEHAPQDPVTGEPQYTTPLAALCILLLTCTAQITILALLVRAFKSCCCRHGQGQGQSACPYAQTSSAPAPSEQSLAPGSHWLSRSMQRVAQGLRRSGRAHEGYTRLPGGEEYAGDNEVLLGRLSAPASVAPSAGNGTEMVTFARATAPPAQTQAQTQAAQQQYATVLVPVTAMPVNAVNMV